MISIRPAPHSFPAGDWPALLGYPLRAGPEGSWGEAEPAGQWAGTHGECGGAAHQPSPSAKGRGQGGVSRRALEAGDPGGAGEASQSARDRDSAVATAAAAACSSIQGGGGRKGVRVRGRSRARRVPGAPPPPPGVRLERGAPCRGGGERRAGGTRRRARTVQSRLGQRWLLAVL